MLIDFPSTTTLSVNKPQLGVWYETKYLPGCVNVNVSTGEDPKSPADKTNLAVSPVQIESNFLSKK